MPPLLPGRTVVTTTHVSSAELTSHNIRRLGGQDPSSMGVHLLLKKQHSSPSLGGSSGGGSSSARPPKGCMAVRVVGPAGGAGDEEERFVVPLGYLKHPLFVALLEAAEEEYGFQQKGAITIPCGVDHFRRVQGIIHQQKHHHQGLLSGGGHNNHHFHIAGCFRA